MLTHAQELKRILSEHDFDEQAKGILIDFAQFTARKYYQLRNALIAFCVVIAIGCAAGIWAVNDLSKDRHADTTAAIRRDCWSTFNGRVVLRTLVGRTGAPLKYNKELAKADPALNSVLRASSKSGISFKNFAFRLLIVPNCEGHNPHPVAPKALNLAGLKNVKQ